MSYSVGFRHHSDPMLLWLWCKPAAAAPIQPLAWDRPYAAGVALKRFFLNFFNKIIKKILKRLGSRLEETLHKRYMSNQ